MLKSARKPKLLFMILVVLLLALALVSVSSAQVSPSGSGWWANPNVQNASGGEATVTIQALHNTDDASATTYNGSVVIAANDSVAFHPGLAANCAAPPAVGASGCRVGLSPDLPAGFNGSMLVSSTAPVVSFVSLKNNQSGSVGVSGGLARSSYEGVGDGSVADFLYFPSFKNNFAGQSTIFYVQAAGGDSTVRITYTTQEAVPQTYTEEKTITANRSYSFVPAAAGVPSCSGGTGNDCRGGAAVEVLSGADVAGTVVEYEDGVSVAEFVLSSSATTPANTDTTLLIPSAKDSFNNQTTGIAIFNTTNSSATANLTYNVKGIGGGCGSISVGDTLNNSVTVPANGTAVVRSSANNTPFPAGCSAFYSVVIAEDGDDQALAATVNQSETTNGTSKLTKYNGFAESSATATVLFPVVKEQFSDNTTGVSLVNSGSVNTTATVTYSGSSGTHVLQTVSMAPGQSITLRQVCLGDPDIDSVVSGGMPTCGNKYSVSATADAVGATIVGFAQEASISGTTLDIQNYGGTNQ